MRFNLRTVLLVFAILSFVLGTMNLFQKGVLVTDFNALGSVPYPTETEWSEIVARHKSELLTGGTNIRHLNNCFANGWQQCFRNFVFEYQPWKYEDVIATRPELLGGNMPDTDRIAGTYGWQFASTQLDNWIELESVQTVKDRIRFVNRSLYVLTACLLVFLCYLACRRKVRKTLADKTRGENVGGQT